MGLFDMFGGGGGSLAIQPGSLSVSASGPLTGVVAFQGGSKAQQITNIKLKLVVEQTRMETALVDGKQVEQERTHGRDVVPFFDVAPAFQSTPGQVTQFPFNVELPMGLLNSTPKQVKYRLVATADIDNAIDPGTNVEIQIVGGAPVEQHVAPPPAVKQPAMPAAQFVEQAGAQSKFDKQAAQPQATPAGGKFDKQAAQPQATPAGAKFDKQAAQPPALGKFDPQQQEQQKGHDPSAKGGAPPPQTKGVPHGGGPEIGARVQAQHTNGQWYPGHVVAMQNGLLGIDWDDEKLGVSTWVQPQQVQPQGK